MDSSVKYELQADKNEALYIYHDKGNLSAVPHFHANIELVYCEKGEFDVIVGGVPHKITQGDIAFIKPFESHFYLGQKKSYVCFVLIISNNLYKRFDFVYGKYFGSVLKYKKGCSEKILNLFKSFFPLKGSMNSLVKSGIANSILGHCAEYFPLERQIQIKSNNVINGILKYIDENIDSDLSLKTLAGRFGYSHTYLSALFKKKIGIPLKTYVSRIKIEKLSIVKEHVEFSNVNQLAQSLGFNSLPAYYRAKKKFITKVKT